MKITDIYSNPAFRAAKRTIDLKYSKAQSAIEKAPVAGSKEYIAELAKNYQKEVKALYNDPASAKAVAPVAKKKAAGKKAAPAKKKAAKKKPTAPVIDDADDIS